MKKKNMVLVLLLFLTGCSDFPTSGKYYQNDEGGMRGQKVTLNKYSGYIVEFDKSLISTINEHEKKKKQFFEDFRKDKSISLPEYLDPASREKADLDYQAVIQKRKDSVRDEYDQWQLELKSKITELSNKLDPIKDKKSVFDKYTLEHETRVEKLQSEIKKQKDAVNKILEAVVDRTNKEIIDNEIPRRKLNQSFFSLKSKVVEYQGVENCRVIKQRYRDKKYPLERYIVIDSLDSDNTCTYINRPAKEVVSDQYDQFVINQFIEMNQFDYKSLENDLSVAKKELKKAAQIASNKTGEKYNTIKRNYDNISNQIRKLESGLDSYEDTLLDDIALKGEGYLNSNKFNDLDLANEAQNFLLKVVFVSPSLNDANRAYKNALEKAFNDSVAKEIESKITNMSEVDEDGEFSGLNGKFGPMVALLAIEASLIKGNNSKSISLSYNEYIDINDENHHLAKKSNLDLIVDMDALKLMKKDDGEITKEDIPNLIYNAIKKKI